MRLKLIVCEVFYREICRLVADSPNRCDVDFLPKGLHDLGVDRMAPRLQEAIDKVPEGLYDAIVLVYGLCNNGIVGLRSGHTRLVVPRAHDCIALFMGSRRAYEEYFHAHPGTYYRTVGWIERQDSAGAGEETVSQKLGLAMRHEDLVRKYGEENARYVMETMGDLTAHYDRLAFIRMGLNGEGLFAEIARQEAMGKGWVFDEVEGSLSLLRKLVHGSWDEDILVLNPGQAVKASHDEGIVKAG